MKRTPDTSPANVARVLRIQANVRKYIAIDDDSDGFDLSAAANREAEKGLRALADALETTCVEPGELYECLRLGALACRGMDAGVGGQWSQDAARITETCRIVRSTMGLP